MNEACKNNIGWGNERIMEQFENRATRNESYKNS